MQDISQQTWHATTIEHSLSILASSKHGLTEQDVLERRDRYGLNQLQATKKRSSLIMFLSQFHNILIYILLISAVISLSLQHIVDSSVIFAVVFLNALVGMVQEGKAEKALEAIHNMLSHMASVIRGGKRHTINAEELVPGDIVLLRAGDKVPADLRILESNSLQIQEAILTGESKAVTKNTDNVSINSALGDRTSMAFSGTTVTYGVGSGIVVATGMQTEIGKVSSMLQSVQKMVTPLLRQMSKFSRWLTFIIVALSALVFAIGVYVWGRGLEEMFMAAVGIAVAAIPEGLPAIITITLAIGVTKMAKHNAIIRRLPAVETMGAVSTICSDKTGTLTRNELAVCNITLPQHDYNVTGAGYLPNGEILENDEIINAKEHRDLLALIHVGLLCNDAELNEHQDGWKLHGNPTDGALLALAMKANFDIALERRKCPKTDIIPFQSEHKFMATLHHDHDGNGYIFVKGAPEKIMDMCHIDKDHWHERVAELAEQGQRVVAFAMRKTSQEHTDLNFSDLENSNLSFLGLCGIMDPPRKEAIQAVGDCRTAGITVKMITGDHAATAKSIAEQVGVNSSTGVLIGADLDELSSEELQDKIKDVDVYARTSPMHKLRLVRALQRNGEVVAMTGDGVNDAPALKQAEIGVAMGQSGTEAAKEVAEMVLADDNFVSIRHAIEAGRMVYDNIKKAILYILPTNAAEGMAVVMAILIGGVLPITPVQILWVNTVTAITLALALGFEDAEDDVMLRKPRDPREPILSKLLMWRIVFVSFLLVAAVFLLFFYERDHGVNLKVARTVVVNMLVMGEVFYLINCRRIQESALNIKTIFGSKAVWIAIGLVMVLQFIYTYMPGMEDFFGSRPISLLHWLQIITGGITIFLLVELEKWFGRLRSRRRYH
ncbi:MAG: cation-transporting P-type ATPase [Gammaproteobacteria bacterium]|nr:cation-transporting P-type ATPase [Gammaproteobacteria bacterium]